MNAPEPLVVDGAQCSFSWSLRRRKIFNRCRREYFYHYYGSAGGGDPFGAPAARRLHRLRNMPALPVYVNHLLISALRRLFSEGAAGPEFFRDAVMELFRNEFRSMISGEWLADHKFPVIREMTLPGADIPAVRGEVLKRLKELLPLWESGAAERLLQVPAESRVEFPFPMKVNFGELVCYCTPVAAWLEEGKFNTAEPGPPEEEVTALHCVYAMNHRGRSPEQTGSFAILDGQLKRTPLPCSFTAALRRIREDADRMLELASPDGRWYEENFPEEKSQCADCRFRSFCGSRRGEMRESLPGRA